jgi:hypothetical protein
MNKTFSLAMSDCVLNIAFVYITITLLLYIKIRTEEEKTKKIDSKADFIISVTWPDNVDADVDSYLKDPTGKICFFGAREIPLASLDRDDVGNMNGDTITLEDGSSYSYDENKEIVTIRKAIDGKYQFNIHLYANKSNLEVPVKIELIRINPRVTTLLSKEIVLLNKGQEETIFKFTLDNELNITDVEDPVITSKFVQDTARQSGF